jgi:hypothetical protein
VACLIASSITLNNVVELTNSTLDALNASQSSYPGESSLRQGDIYRGSYEDASEAVRKAFVGILVSAGQRAGTAVYFTVPSALLAAAAALSSIIFHKLSLSGSLQVQPV